MNSQPRLGRNDPCWCGSGKKYKHCHQSQDQERASESLQKDALWNALGEFASQRKYQTDFISAAKFFFDSPNVPALEGSVQEQEDFERAFDYFVFDYRLPDDSRLIERFERERGRTLAPRQRAWLAGWVQSYPHLLQITQVQPGIGLSAQDLLTGDIYNIRDKVGSESVSRWTVSFTRVIHAGDHDELGGAGLNVPPRYRGMLLDYIQQLRDEYEERYPDAALPDFLRAHAHLVNQYILDEIGSLMAQPPLMVTPEHDLMENAVATFDVLDHAQALARLRAAPEFETVEPATPDTQLFVWNETGESLAELRAHGIPFERQTPIGDSANVRALGTVTLQFDELTLEVMSRRRLDAGKAILTRQLGDAIRFRTEQVEPLAGFGELNDDGLDADDELDDEWDEESAEDSDETDELDAEVSPFDPSFAPPETILANVRELLGRFRGEYNENWIDLSLPVLDGQTPRAAVASFGGRIRVIRLLKDFESRDRENNLSRGTVPYDWGAVARQLGLTDQEFLDEARVETQMYEQLSLVDELTAQNATDNAWASWRKFRETFPIARAQELEFAEVWDLQETLSEVAMDLEFLLARQKRFDDAQALVEDYITLEADEQDWALAERAALRIERAIYSDPEQVQAGVQELDALARNESTAFQALITLGEIQENLLGDPDAGLNTLLRAERLAGDEMEAERVSEMLLEHFTSFRECDAGKMFWHQSNDALSQAERDVPGLLRLLFACDELDAAAAAIQELEIPETRDYFSGKLAARRGDLAQARQFWQSQLADAEEMFDILWFDWAELALALRDSAAVLEKLETIPQRDHQLAHWFRALAFAQLDQLENAARAAGQARAAMRAQVRRLEYSSTLRQQRADARALGLSVPALNALNFDAPVEQAA